MKKVIKAPAKVNLCLKINGKREDGYHEITARTTNQQCMKKVLMRP